METVDMRCPSCGGSMKIENGQFVCPYCGSIAINIAETQVDDSTARLSVEEFAKKLAENKKLLVVKMDSSVEIFDVEAKIINKKVADATKALTMGDFSTVLSILTGIYGVFPAERLKYLANYKAKSESELIKVRREEYTSTKGGYIDGYNYEALLASCDEATRKVYIELEQYHRKQADFMKKVWSDVQKTYSLKSAGLYKDSVDYARAMCVKYPSSAISWNNLAYILLVYRRKLNSDFNVRGKNNVFGKNDEELFYELNESIKKMRLCPDYEGDCCGNKLLYQYAAEGMVDRKYAGGWCYFSVENNYKVTIKQRIDRFGAFWIYNFFGHDMVSDSFCFRLTVEKYFIVGAVATLLGGVIALILSAFGVSLDFLNKFFNSSAISSPFLSGIIFGALVGFVFRGLLGTVMSLFGANYLLYPLYPLLTPLMNRKAEMSEEKLSAYKKFKDDTVFIDKL